MLRIVDPAKIMLMWHCRSLNAAAAFSEGLLVASVHVPIRRKAADFPQELYSPPVRNSTLDLLQPNIPALLPQKKFQPCHGAALLM